jgi:hypothetical protein
MKFPMVSSLLLACGWGAAAQDTGALIDKVAAAYGGEAALARLGAWREEGRVEATMRVGSSGRIARIFVRPLKLRVEVGQQPQPVETRVLDGTNGWRNGRPVSGTSYEVMALQALRLDLPWQLFSHKTSVREKEPKEHEGHRLRVLELPLENGLALSAGIDPDTGRILFSSGTTQASPMTFETSYEDFRIVDGRLFAFKETNFAQGTRTAQTVITNVEVLKSPPAEAFKP